MNDMIPVSSGDTRPLPLIVAEKWNFKLSYVFEDEQFWYAALDWIMGLLKAQARTATLAWYDIQHRSSLDSSFTKRLLPYTARDGKTYMRDYTTDKGLYVIAQHLETNRKRPLLKEIQEYLAKAGVFVDEVRRKPETVVESGAIDPDKAIEAAIAEYKRRGKSDDWINARIFGKLKRASFTAALKAAIADVTKEHYRLATDDIYLGLWQRTAKKLKEEMELDPKANLRDHQPLPALHYQALAEDGCARRLGERQELSWEEAQEIVRLIASLVGRQAQEYGEFFGIDVATGKPLLGSGS